MRPSRYPVRRRWLPTLRSPVRWLVRIHPLQSWLVVMAIILGLSLLRLRWLALVVAIGWTSYAIYTWVRPSLRRRRWR